MYTCVYTYMHVYTHSYARVCADACAHLSLAWDVRAYYYFAALAARVDRIARQLALKITRFGIATLAECAWCLPRLQRRRGRKRGRDRKAWSGFGGAASF